MKTFKVYLYSIQEKRSDSRFLELFAQKTGWSQEKIEEFLSQHDSAIFHDRPLEEAVGLIRDFQAVGVFGALNGVSQPTYYRKQFQKFYERGGAFAPTWNWAAALFSWLWQIFRGLWAKWILYGTVYTLISFAMTWFPFIPPVPKLVFSLLSMVAAFIFYGVVSNYDYFLKKTRNENFWEIFPFRKYKAVFWVALVVFLGIYIMMPAIAFQNVIRVQRQMANPVISTGEPMEWNGIRFSPRAGWQIIEGLASMHGPDFLMIIPRVSEFAEEGEEREVIKGQMNLTVHKPSRRTPFVSVDQEEVQNIIQPMTIAYQNPFMKMAFRDVWVSDPEYFDLEGQPWGYLETGMSPRGPEAGTVLVMKIYYTIGDGRLVILNYQGMIEEGEEIQNALEEFLGTFEFGVESDILME